MNNSHKSEKSELRVNLSLTESQHEKISLRFIETYQIDPAKLPQAMVYRLVLEDWLSSPRRPLTVANPKI